MRLPVADTEPIFCLLTIESATADITGKFGPPNGAN